MYECVYISYIYKAFLTFDFGVNYDLWFISYSGTENIVRIVSFVYSEAAK